MTLEEALNTIEIAIAEVEWCYPLEYAEAFEMAKEALEKQMPMKPYNKQNSFLNCDIINCPTCKKRLKVKSKGRYCDKCGRKLDWSETE